MNKGRHYIAVVLMFLAIIAVTVFQLYWIYKNYQEEKKLLTIRTNILFREAVNQCQSAKLNLDSNFSIRLTTANGAVNMMDAFRRKLKADTTKRMPGTNAGIVISMKKEEDIVSTKERFADPRIDTLKKTIHFINKPGDAGWIEVFQGVDSLQDSVTIKEITDQYLKSLVREKIEVPFFIARKVNLPQDEFVLPEMEKENKITVGFFRPITFELTIQNTHAYLLKRLSMPIIVSLLLVGLTIISFVLMLNNLVKQRKLTQLKNEFVSNITHELKTPIATVGVAIEALRNFNAINDPQRTKEYLDISSSEIQRLGLLVDKVLKLSMFETREIDLHNESLDFLDLTREVMASMKLQFEKQQAVVTLETIGTNFTIEADKLHLSSVIYNLLDNALKYSKGIPEIDIRLVAHEQHLALHVTDKGIGIPKEYKGKIFEKFFRIPGGDRHNIKGYGLGLSYVNHIIKRHMGFIDVKSELGNGSTFIVNIPYKQADTIRFDEHRVIRKDNFKTG
ncbi:MAG: sensor histidine kinase [Chitinophagaceae bacterium]